MNIEGNIHKLGTDSVNLLKEMVSIPSPSFEESAVCSHICSWMDRVGIIHERVGNNIVAELHKQEGCCGNTCSKRLMLCAHIDTVPPCDGYGFDPYLPDYAQAAGILSEKTGKKLGPEDIVVGLGSNDDGASAVAMIAVFRYFMDKSASEINGTDITLVLSCEEERSGKAGMTGLWGTRLCRRDADLEGCIKVDNAIVGEPTAMRAAVSERGLLVIDATAHGVSGHAARNEGRNALYIALDDIARLRSHQFARLSPTMGKINLNVTQINAGSAHNVIPDRCSFVIDIRPTEKYTNEEILDELKGICESELIPRNLSNRSSAAAEGSLLVKTAQSMGIVTFSSPTTSDWMRIDCDALKMGPGDSSRSHRPDEYVLVSEIEEAIQTYIDFIVHYHEHTLE
jgi:acetylornithine deacetylase